MSDTERLSRTNNDGGGAEGGHNVNTVNETQSNVDNNSPVAVALISQPSSIEREVYLAAAYGRKHILQGLLCNKGKCEVRKILATKTVTNTVITETTTPFIMASKSFRNDTVRWLLNDFRDELDLEQTGTVRFYDGLDGLTFKGASALWCAARAGNLEIVEMLLESGADVNHPTFTNSTPLLAACWNGYMDIVTLLIRNNANLDAADFDGNTALHVSAERGHIKIVEALINAGASKLTNIANLNAADNDGNTALHVSAERGHIKIVEALVNAGASKLKNNAGMTFLHLAVFAEHENIILFYVHHSTCSRLDRIESYELLGAACGNLDIFNKFYKYMWLAMKERYNSSAPGVILEKKVMQPVEAYENRIECRNYKELLAIKDNHDLIRMEALIVFERVLGEDNLAVRKAIRSRATFFRHSSPPRFDRCTLLWKRAMHLKQKHGHSIKEELQCFAEEFSQMLLVGGSEKFTIAKDVVRLLLNDFRDKLDLEQTGTVTFYDYLKRREEKFEGACALWCAARAGNSEIVEMLLEAGADVNHATLTNSTPLLAACWNGYMDIVTLLIKNNANLNAADLDGNTALHVSAERGHIKIVEALVNAGASKLKNKAGMTFLHLAVFAGHEDIILFYVDHSICSRLDRIESYELLGAACGNQDISDWFYKYMLLAMKERYNSSAPGGILEKKVMAPVQAYENRIESRNVEELLAIKDNQNAIRMESLIVFERVLGEDNLAVQIAITSRGKLFRHSYRFDRCTLLWKRAMHLKENNGHSIEQELRYLAEVFCEMHYRRKSVKFTLAEDVFDHCLKEIARDQERLNNETIEDRYEPFLMNYTVLHLLSLMITIQKSDEEQIRLCCLVKRLNKFKLSLFSKEGSTPLHMVCDNFTLVKRGFVHYIVKLPDVQLLELLLKCGADPNELDNNGNTALHIIQCHNHPTSDFMLLRKIVTKLIEYGVHIDRANRKGVTASKIVKTITGISHINVQCLAARVVRKHNIPYIGHVPPLLCKFIEMH